MRYVYVCPKCRGIYSNESTSPNEAQKCPDCNDGLYYLKCIKSEWDQKSSSEKTVQIDSTIAEKIHGAADTSFIVQEKLEKIEDHLSVIKNILIFFTVLWVLGVIIIVINLY